MKHLLLLCFLAINFFTSYAQPGCTDPQAMNFDATATSNDGSCTYGITNYSLTNVTTLDDELKECSGLEVINSQLWIHNDGGNADEIYRVDSVNGAILQTIIIATADNIDWEEFAEDETYLYLGDFGNNPGNRTDLRIYRINKSDLSNNIINADLIEFSYSDQTDFTENHNDNDFDCEAFVFYNDSLHLFTKNWVDNQTKHYVVPAIPGNHTAELIETFNVQGLVTAADISENNELVLVGYTEISTTFMWLMFDFSGSQFFSGNKRMISTGSAFSNGQVEGVSFVGDGYGYICSEEFKVGSQVFQPQKITSFSINQWIDNTTNVHQLDNSYQVLAYPNPFKNYLQVELSKPVDAWILYNSSGQILRFVEPGNNTVINFSTTNLPAGIYFFEIRKGKENKIVELIKQ